MSKFVIRQGFLSATLLLASYSGAACQPELDDLDVLFSLSVEELLQVPIGVGTRGERRQWRSSTVPIDVVTKTELQSTGFVDLNQILLHTLPYFNYQHLTLRDGSDHSRPFSLRGMSPDQVLVLVNGKRYHPGALTHLSTALGKGANHVDLSFFPVSAIERIEILKDGAAAQYGSDAIAGIINIVLATNSNDQIQLSGGSTYTGDGEYWSVEANKNFSFDEDSFIQTSISNRHFNKTIRAGNDTRQQYFNGDSRNNDPSLNNLVNMELGNPQRSDFVINLNGQSKLNDFTFYGFANFAHRNSTSAGFFRRALDNRTLRSRYPDGFLPRINAKIDDLSINLGLTKSKENQWSFDLSNTYGENRFHYFVTDSVNVSMGEDSPSRFDSGQLFLAQDTLNFDWSNVADTGVEAKFSFGLEYRYERYQIVAGEQASYIHGGVPVLDGPNAGALTQAGAQVFPGFKPDNALKVSHNSYAGYIDVERQPWSSLQLQGALRYEYHNDFGSTFDYKIAGRYHVTDTLHILASTSTGFRAPTLAQKNFTSTALGFIDNQLLNLGTFSVDAPVSIALGAKPLKPEQSTHFALGLSFQAKQNLLFELDFFNIDIEDRIGLSGTISQNPQRFSDEVVAILQSYQAANARFFTNAIDTQTQGVDLSMRYSNVLANGHTVSLKMNYHYNQTKLVGKIKTPGPLGNNPDVIFNRSEANRLTARQPNNNISATLQYKLDALDITVKALRFGSVHLIFDNDQPQHDQDLAANWLMDLDIRYLLTPEWSVSLGAQNLFNRFPANNNEITASAFYGKDRIFQYSDSSPFGVNGGTWYLKTLYRF